MSFPVLSMPCRLMAGLVTGVAVLVAPVVANEPPTPRLTFGFDQRLEAIDNSGLNVPSLGRTVQSVTRLNFGFVSETPREALSFTGGSGFRLGDRPQGSISAFDDTRLGLTYRREGGDSEFQIRASARQARIETLRSLLDFVDEDGVLQLPEDFDELSGFGRRTSYDVEARLALGQEAAPVGVTFTLGAGGIDYGDGATQNDIRTLRAGVDTRFRLSPVLTATLGVRREERRELASVTEKRVTDRVEAGAIYALSPRTDLRARLGYSQVDRTGTIVRREEGVVGGVDLDVDTPDGSYGFFVDARQLETGQELSGGVRRSIELPRGAVSGSVGATRLPGRDNALIGTLSWRQDLPDGPLTVNLSRQSVTGDLEDPRIRTVASASYAHQVNQVSSFSLRADHARSDGSAQRNQIEESSLRLTYTRQLTADWSLNSGVGYRVRREETIGRATSPEIFIGLGRSFLFPL